MQLHGLRSYRKNILGWGLNEAAENLGVSKQLLNRWERTGRLTMGSATNMVWIYECVGIVTSNGFRLATKANTSGIINTKTN
jgi:transcriptional regulator with XRE-family HTH domain